MAVQQHAMSLMSKTEPLKMVKTVYCKWCLFYHNKWKRLKILELLSTENQKVVSRLREHCTFLGKTATRGSHTDKFKPWDSPSMTCMFWPTPSFSFTLRSQITLFNPSYGTQIQKTWLSTQGVKKGGVSLLKHRCSNFKEKILIIKWIHVFMFFLIKITQKLAKNKRENKE